MLFPVGSEYPISLGWICYRCQPTVLLKVLQNLFIHFPERKNNLQSALNYHYFFGNFLKSSKENISIPSTTTLPIQTELEKKGCHSLPMKGLLSFLEMDKPEYGEILFSNWKEVRMQLMYTQTHMQVYRIIDPVDRKWKSYIHTTIYK